MNKKVIVASVGVVVVIFLGVSLLSGARSNVKKTDVLPSAQQLYKKALICYRENQFVSSCHFCG